MKLLTLLTIAGALFLGLTLMQGDPWDHTLCKGKGCPAAYDSGTGDPWDHTQGQGGQGAHQ